MTGIFNEKKHIKKRQYLRNNMTKAEIVLWSRLKGKQLNGWNSGDSVALIIT